MVARFHTCDRLRLRQALTGDLPAERQHEFDEHLQHCDHCRNELELLAGKSQCWGDIRDALSSSEIQPWKADRDIHLHAARPNGEPASDADRSLPPDGVTADAVIEDDAWRSDFLEPSDDPSRLGRLGGYDVERVIGRGGMGVVLKAYDRGLNRHVAIKVLAAQLSTSAAARRRFAREAQAAAAVVHDHVVPIFAVDAAGRLPYLVMAYIDGRSLQERIDQTGPLEIKDIVRIAMQAAAGLAAAHAQGLVHRDIKPANILLENGVERVRLTDFGLARAVDDASQTQSGFIAGTPQFMAPEQARGESVDFRADLFSLGSVMYCMCAGQPPFRADSTLAVLRRICEDEPRDVREKNADIPAWLSAIVRRLHAKNLADRFQSAAEVAELLGQYLAWLQQPTICPMPSPTEAPARPRPAVGDQSKSRSAAPDANVAQGRLRWRRWGLIVGAIVVVATLGGARLLGWGSWPLDGQPDARPPVPTIPQATADASDDEFRWDSDVGTPTVSGPIASGAANSLSADLEATRRTIEGLETSLPSAERPTDGRREFGEIQRLLDRLEQELEEPDA